jgi:hypothetical protein
MSPDNRAANAHDLTGQRCIWPPPGNKLAIPSRRDKTNVLAIGLVGNRETKTCSDSAHLRLVWHVPEWKQTPLQLQTRRSE